MKIRRLQITIEPYDSIEDFNKFQVEIITDSKKFGHIITIPVSDFESRFDSLMDFAKKALLIKIQQH